MRPDGADLRRITYFNGNAHRQVAGFPPPHYAAVCGLAIDAGHPKIVYAANADRLGGSVFNLWKIVIR